MSTCHTFPIAPIPAWHSGPTECHIADLCTNAVKATNWIKKPKNITFYGLTRIPSLNCTDIIFFVFSAFYCYTHHNDSSGGTR